MLINLTRHFSMVIINNNVNNEISGGYAYCLLYPEGWFACSIDSQHSGSSKPMSLLKLLSSVICMCRASLNFNSRFLLALSTTPTSSGLLGWCCCQACSAVAETFSSPLLQASWCSSTLCSSLLVSWEWLNHYYYCWLLLLPIFNDNAKCSWNFFYGGYSGMATSTYLPTWYKVDKLSEQLKQPQKELRVCYN